MEVVTLVEVPPPEGWVEVVAVGVVIADVVVLGVVAIVVVVGVVVVVVGVVVVVVVVEVVPVLACWMSICQPRARRVWHSGILAVIP